MRAHVIKDGVVANTIEVKSLDFMPGLIDAAQGGVIGDLWDGMEFTKPFTPVPPQDSVALAATLADQIDDAVARICAKPQRFVKEYEEREAQARAYINEAEALPPGSPLPPAPPRIAAFAKSSGLSEHVAGRLTIAQADGLRSALGQLADLRMRKYEIKRAPSVSAMQAVFDEIMAEINKVVIP